MTSTGIIITTASASIGFIFYKMLLTHKKSGLKVIKKELLEILESREKQKNMIFELSNSYYNSMSESGQRALNELDIIIKEVNDVLCFAEEALESSSIFEVNKAIKVIGKFNKKTKKSSKDLEYKIRNTWESTTQKLINMIAEEVSSSSEKHKALGYHVPKARIFKKPTELALQELKNLLT